MNNYIKQILHTQVFSLLSVFLGFSTILILIDNLKPVEYGEYILIQGFIAFGGLLFSQNLYSYTRLHIPGANIKTQYGYLKTVIIVVLFCYLSVLFVLRVFDLEQHVWVVFEIDSSIGIFVLVMLCLELVNLELMRFFISTQKIVKKNYAQFFQKILIFVGTIILSKTDSISLRSFLFLYILGQLFVFIFFLLSVDIKIILKSPFMTDVLKKGYGVALPLLPIGLMNVALNYTDTLMISKFVNKEYVAQYGFASQIVSIAMMIIGTSVVLTLFPYATEAHNQNNFKLRTFYIIKMIKMGIVLSILFYFLIIINSSWIIEVLHLDDYNNIPSYFPVIGLFPLFRLIYNVSSHHLQILKVFKIQIYFAIIVIIENAVLNYFSIESYGVIGAAGSSLISYMTLSAMFGLVSVKSDNVLFLEIKKIFNLKIMLILVGSVISILMFKLYQLNIFIISSNIGICILLVLKVPIYKKGGIYDSKNL